MRRIIYGMLGTLFVATSAMAQDANESGILTTEREYALSIRGALQAAIAADVPTSAERLSQQLIAPARSSEAPAARVAQDAAAPERIASVSAGMDFTNAYFFRGYYQEASGFIGQPWVDVGVTASETVALNFGMWNSVHSSDDTGKFYEADYYAGATFTVGNFSPGVVYTAYTSPADVFDTIHEVAMTASYDDGDSAFPIAPNALVALDFENDWHYWEVGIEPAIPTEGSPVSLSVPVTLGMSLQDYYDEAFGFFSVGLNAAVPISSQAEFWAGVQFLALGDTTKALNDDEGTKAIVAVGLSASY